MVGLPRYLATKEDFENALAACRTVGEMQIIKQKFEGIKAQDKIKVLKKSAAATKKMSKSDEDIKETSEFSADDFEEIDAPIGVEGRFGIKVVEIDALIDKLNKKIAGASK